MKRPTVRAWPGPLAVKAQAEFTLDMLRNLVVVFEAAAEDRSILIEMGDRGVWAVTHDGHRLFIGQTAVPPPQDA